ncbi:MAG TPA: hypothetical protein VK131_07560 [Candidatus Acidoferrales bacterium]|nr:hypothetical protein [Candidatus Acidoferrales bacterium]
MAVYTYVQLFEVALFAAVLLLGLAYRDTAVAVIGGGLLVGKALLTILGPEVQSLYRRSLIGYGVGALFVIAGLVLLRLVGS